MAGDWGRAVLFGLAAFGGTVLLVPVARRFALAFGMTDRPRRGKVHLVVTPYLGGVAIGLVLLGGSAFLPQWKVEAAVILLAALLVALVGLLDDIRTLGPAPRLFVEAAAASAVYAAGARAELLGGAADWLLTVAWIVILTNAFNLLDNMDGCAGVIATVTAVTLTVAANLEGQLLVGGLAALVAGACAGFLLHNWPPARIFMGDAGSLFLGFLLSTIALKLRFPVAHGEGIPALILFAGPALFDTTLVVLSRTIAHRPIYVGGTDHTSHRLARLGLTTPVIIILMAVGTAVCCALGVAVGRGVVSPTLALTPLLILAAGLLAALLTIPVYEEASEREVVAVADTDGLITADHPLN